MAWIKQRNKTWYAIWNQDGKRIVKSTGISGDSARNKRMAQSVADAMEVSAKGELSLNKALDSVRQAAEIHGFASTMPTIQEYFSNFKPTGKANHISNRKRALKIFCDYLGAAALRRLDSLTVSQCRDFVTEQLKRVSLGTAKHYKGSVLNVLNRAVEDGLIQNNPMAIVKMSQIQGAATERATKRLPFTVDELQTIFTKFASPWRELALTSFLTGGQRLGDIALLKWSSVDLDKKYIDFRTLKTGKKIMAPIVPELMEILLEQKKNNNTEWVFPYIAQRYNRSKGCISVEFTAQLRAHGIKTTSDEAVKTGDRRAVAVKSFHSLRHSVVSFMRTDNRFTADLVRDIVGHDSEDVERGYYTADLESRKMGLSFLASIAKNNIG